MSRLGHVIRRLTALLLASAVLHLSVARADADCDMHTHDAPATGHEGMHHDASAPAEDEQCETVASDCCLALLSCAPMLRVSEVAMTSDSPLARVAILQAVIELPLSRTTAPEPPPPKA